MLFMEEKSIWDILNKKEIRCRYCDTLMEMNAYGYNCPFNSCGSAYKEQHWYVKLKNGAIMNLWDYFEFHINPNELELNECMKIAEYELKNRENEGNKKDI